MRQFANGRIDDAGLPSEATDDESPAETKKARSSAESDGDSENDGDGEDDENEGDHRGDNKDANVGRPARASSRTTRPAPSTRTTGVARAVTPPTPGPSKPPQRATATVRFRSVPVHIHDTPRREVAPPTLHRSKDWIELSSDESDSAAYQADPFADSPSPTHPRKAGHPTATKRKEPETAPKPEAKSGKAAAGKSRRQDDDEEVSSSIASNPVCFTQILLCTSSQG